jgi:hypothetical protein
MISHNHPIKATLALVVACGAVVPAAASARPLPADPPWPANQPSVQVVEVSGHHGFEWGDAGIGAAAGLGLSMLAAGGVVVSQRRGRHARGSTGAAS